MALAQVLDIGFRTYVRYEAGERDAPISLLVKLAKLGNISLDRLLTTQVDEADLKIPDISTLPAASKKLEVIGGSMDEGRLVFKGVKQDFLISSSKNEKKLLTLFRKMDRPSREKFLLEIEWMLNNTRPASVKPGRKKKVAKKVTKAKNAARLKKVARSIKKITLKG